MTDDDKRAELVDLGIAINGQEFGWQTNLARILEINRRTVRRWAAGEQPVMPMALVAARAIRQVQLLERQL